MKNNDTANNFDASYAESLSNGQNVKDKKVLICEKARNLEVDYDKKEVRAGGRIVDFESISHYEFEHVETVWKDDYDMQDSDMRASIDRHKEIMRICGTCVELPLEYHPFSATTGFDEVKLKLWFNYYQGEELKQTSLDFSQNDALKARNKLKPLIKQLREKTL